MTTLEPKTDGIKSLEGQRATLMLVNTMGFPVCRQITIKKVEIVSAKRYQGHMTDKRCLQLQYVEKGKRNPHSTRYVEVDLAIATGWQEIQLPSEFVGFEEGLLAVMTSQAKDIVYTQQGLS